jgi:hypothetical protein
VDFMQAFSDLIILTASRTLLGEQPLLLPLTPACSLMARVERPTDCAPPCQPAVLSLLCCPPIPLLSRMAMARCHPLLPLCRA